MRAAVNKEYGPPSVIKIQQVEKPSPNSDQILIKIEYAGANRTDSGFLQAKPFVTRFFTGLLKPKYSSLGCEFSGVVESIGSSVAEFKKGDRVFGFDDKDFGAFAEYKVINASSAVAKIPSGITAKDAAAATEGAHYALYYIYKIKNIAKSRVFVNGGTGAIGSAAIQLLKERGAYVYASSTTEQINMVKNIGADNVIDWQKDDITKLDQNFDVFFDAVGKSRFSIARKILKPGGLYMSSELGPYGQNPILTLLNPMQKIFTKRNIAFPIPYTKKEDIQEIARVLESRSFNPVIDSEYSLDETAKALERVESGKKVGGVVINIY